MFAEAARDKIRTKQRLPPCDTKAKYPTRHRERHMAAAIRENDWRRHVSRILALVRSGDRHSGTGCYPAAGERANVAGYRFLCDVTGCRKAGGRPQLHGDARASPRARPAILREQDEARKSPQCRAVSGRQHQLAKRDSRDPGGHRDLGRSRIHSREHDRRYGRAVPQDA